MQIVLRQIFPLGRFHATPWRVNPFDDPHGEWPPSPWRLVRAVSARWYQWIRETVTEPNLAQLEQLQAALCTSAYAFYLPVNARMGSPIRQYHPMELEMDPPNWRHVARWVRSSDKEKIKEYEDKQKRIKKLKGVKLSVTKNKNGCEEWEITVKDKDADQTKQEIKAILGVPTSAWQRVADAGVRSYRKSLVQDNYWCVWPEAPVWWFIDGNENWTKDLLEVFDRCLARVTYFGRAETFTRIERVTSGYPEPNCRLSDKPGAGAVPVLVPLPDATRVDLERTTEDGLVAKRSIPPGAIYRYAIRPQRPLVHEHRRPPTARAERHLIQFAIGWNVAPELRAIVRLTSRFRGAVLRELLRIKSKGEVTSWSRASRDLREQVVFIAGKDAEGKPLRGPRRHAEFFAWCEDEVPTRLLVWRGSQPFNEEEENAILAAARRELSWAAPGNDADVWKVRLVPLDRAVPAPPGFDGVTSRTWASVIPYVPARHHLRGGKLRERESIQNQVQRELELRGFPAQGVQVEVGESCWVAVHLPRSLPARRAYPGDRRGYRLCVTFPAPVSGPISLGHSSSFGLGLLRPAKPSSAHRES